MRAVDSAAEAVVCRWKPDVSAKLLAPTRPAQDGMHRRNTAEHMGGSLCTVPSRADLSNSTHQEKGGVHTCLPHERSRLTFWQIKLPNDYSCFCFLTYK